MNLISPKNLSEWSRMVRDRDGVCCECGTEKSLNAHHQRSKSRFPELALDLNNGITLCSNCHDEHHKANPDHFISEKTLSKKAKRKTENALLQAKNSALKFELKQIKLAPKGFDKSLQHELFSQRIEILHLKAQLAEYERAYNALVSLSE